MPCLTASEERRKKLVEPHSGGASRQLLAVEGRTLRAMRFVRSVINTVKAGQESTL